MFYFLAVMALAVGMFAAHAQSTVATVPEGMINFSLPHGTTTYLSLPLTNNSTCSDTVSAVTTNTISVDDAPVPLTTSLATPATPYFVKFLSGSESGRVMLITGNTSSTLTLDTTDNNTGDAIALTTTNFSVQVGDAFEIFPGDTLASVFGAGTAQSPLLLTGGANIIFSDTLTFYTSAGAPATTYYFNTTNGYWQQYGSQANANNVIIYPYAAFCVTLRGSHPDTTLVRGGRVTPVPALTKLIGNGTIYSSTQYPVDVTLSQLQFGSNWVTGADVLSSDTISVWNAGLRHFDTFYQEADSTWRKYPDAVTDQSNFTITAGAVITIAKREAVTDDTGAYLTSALPYSLN